VAERLTLHVGHDIEQTAGYFARVVDGEDVGVGEVGSDLDLAQEPLGAHRLGQLGDQYLDGDLAAMLAVLRQVHGRVPPAAELARERVPVGERGREPVQ